MKKTKFEIVKKRIVNFFNTLNKNIFSFRDISKILKKNRKVWKLPISMTVRTFLDLLITNTKLIEHKFNFPSYTINRYSWGEVSVFELVSSLKAESYFSHHTAMYLLGLTKVFPATIYLNQEQTPKYFNNDELIQSNIERAFRSSQRVSHNIAEFGRYKICLLNGKYTNKRGVIDIAGDYKNILQVTNLERSLIDIVVRPGYAGGVVEVLKAFRIAKKEVSVNKMLEFLKQLNFVYPYHQAIGFYLERAEYNKFQIEIMDKLEKKYDFYLTHAMKKTDYSHKWKIYYPKNLSEFGC